MKNLFIKYERRVIVLLLIGLVAVLAACDTTSPDEVGEGEEKPNSGNVSTDSASKESEGGSDGQSEASSSNQNTSESGVDQGAETERASDTGTNSQGASLLDVDPQSIEADVNGITVGFTMDGHPFIGDPSAPVLIEEYSDFQCPYCSRFYKQTLPDLQANQISDGEAVLVYYDFPLERLHPQSAAAANAARCAGEQGAANYWLMHDALFENIGEWSGQNYNDMFTNYADDIGLEIASYSQCLDDNQFESQIEADLDSGSALGITGTPSFVLNGELLVGAQPVEIFNAAISALKEGGTLTVSGSEDPPGPPPPGAAPTPAVFSDGYAGAIGNPNAPVTIVEFTDYQCPYCSRHSIETMPRILADMVDTGRVYYILKDFPLDGLHPEARKAAVAGRCAGDQDSYWEMHDAIFANQGEWAGQGEGANTIFTNYSASIGLDEDSFASCLDSGRHDLAIESDVQEGQSLGVNGTPHFFVDGYPLNGARPIEHFVAAVSLAEEGRLAEAFTPPAEPTPAGPAEISTGGSFSIGDPDAPITLIEYTDFQCPYCSRHYQQTYPRIVEQYVDTGIVRYVFKDFPLTQLHPQAIVAAEATRCAQDQGAFLEMHDSVFNGQGEWSGNDPVDVFVGYADRLGLDSGTFRECLTSNQHEEAVLADLQEGVALGVTGTPSFFVNGYALTGAQPFEVFQQAIDSLLQETG